MSNTIHNAYYRYTAACLTHFPLFRFYYYFLFPRILYTQNSKCLRMRLYTYTVRHTHTHKTLCFVSALVTLEIDNNSSTALTCVQFDYLHYRLPRNTNTRAHAELFLSYRRSTRHSKRSFPTFRYLKCYD